MRRYSEAVKADVRRRMSPPHRQSVAQISAELGIHIVTLYNWRKAWRLQGEVLEHQGIAGTEGREGKWGSHLGTAENPTPNGQPQGCDKDAPTGRMARSLTQREDWTRDLGGCLTA